jgi:hypothetical protein
MVIKSVNFMQRWKEWQMRSNYWRVAGSGILAAPLVLVYIL